MHLLEVLGIFFSYFCHFSHGKCVFLFLRKRDRNFCACLIKAIINVIISHFSLILLNGYFMCVYGNVHVCVGLSVDGYICVYKHVLARGQLWLSILRKYLSFCF